LKEKHSQAENIGLECWVNIGLYFCDGHQFRGGEADIAQDFRGKALNIQNMRNAEIIELGNAIVGYEYIVLLMDSVTTSRKRL